MVEASDDSARCKPGQWKFYSLQNEQERLRLVQRLALHSNCVSFWEAVKSILFQKPRLVVCVVSLPALPGLRLQSLRTCLMKNSLSKLDLSGSGELLFADAGVVPMLLFFLSKGETTEAWLRFCSNRQCVWLQLIRLQFIKLSGTNHLHPSDEKQSATNLRLLLLKLLAACLSWQVNLRVNLLDSPPLQYVGLAVSPLTDFWVSDSSIEESEVLVPCLGLAYCALQVQLTLSRLVHI